LNRNGLEIESVKISWHIKCQTNIRIWLLDWKFMWWSRGNLRDLTFGEGGKIQSGFFKG